MLNDVDPLEEYIHMDDSLGEVACFVNHVYAGDQFIINMDNLLDCSRMAAKYDMPWLQRAIVAFVQHLKLTDANLPGWMVAAHGDPEVPGLAMS
jgi:hypothetical protein